jgi:hypothetical protein
MSFMPHHRLPETVDGLADTALRLISRLVGEGRLEQALGVRQALEPALIRHREYMALRGEPARILVPAVHRAETAALRFIGQCKGRLRPGLGHRWNPRWVAAGFEGGSLAVPGSARGRKELLGKLRDYLRAHPEMEDPGAHLTASRADQLLESLQAARNTLRGHPSRQQAARTARRKACSGLRKLLRQALGRSGGLVL